MNTKVYLSVLGFVGMVDKKKYLVVKEVRKPIVIRFRRKDGSVVEFKGTKIIRKPQKIVFRKIKKEYKKNE